MKMRSTLLLTGILVGSACLSHGAITDITIYDGLTGNNYGSDSRSGIFETKEVEVGNVATDMWDMRAFGYDYASQKLTYQGGYNPLMATNPAQSLFGIGSIFIETSDLPTTLPRGVNGGSDGFRSLENGDLGSKSYEYAVTLAVQGSSLVYNIYKLTLDSALVSAYFGSNREAGPYAFVPTGETLLGSGTANVSLVTANTFAAHSADYGGLQSFSMSNYFAEFDLSDIAGQLSGGAAFHLTMACGNDSMVGQIGAQPTPGISSIPEPGNVAGLMGLLLAGAFLRSRRSAKA